MSLKYIEKINNLIEDIIKTKQNIKVMDAGCGLKSYFRFGENANIIGLDISKEQLTKNRNIHLKIQGDLEMFPIQADSFDVIICLDVLEHLKNPTKVLNNFVCCLKNDGIMVIGVPNVLSVKGLMTKFTPYKFHYWCNSKVMKWKSTPFPTYMRMTISPNALIKFAKVKNINIVFLHYREEWINVLKGRSKAIYVFYLGISTIIKFLSFGIIKIRKTDFMIVYKK